MIITGDQVSDYQPLAKKSLGQHWLHDEASLLAICEVAELRGSDVVLEIGPGLGTLTQLLTERVSRVVAVEFDEKLARDLSQRVRADNLEVVSQDILEFNFSDLPPDYKIVANIPYYLTSNLIRVISETSNPPNRAVLLVQKEVAERVAASPGKLSILSVTAQFYWEVSLGDTVPAKLFTPPPKVDSQILILQGRSKPLFPGVNAKDFFRLVKVGFAQRRKTLLNSLSTGLHISREQVQKVGEQTGIDPQRRAQTLSLEEWYKLYQTLNT